MRSLVDWLLESATHAGFSSHAVNGHSSREEGLSLAEQVAGRKRAVRFQMHVHEAQMPEFMAQLKKDFAGTGLHYWIVPIIDAGHI